MAPPIQDRLSKQPYHLGHPELRVTGDVRPEGTVKRPELAAPSALSVTPAKALVIQSMPGSCGGMLPPPRARTPIPRAPSSRRRPGFILLQANEFTGCFDGPARSEVTVLRTDGSRPAPGWRSSAAVRAAPRNWTTASKAGVQGDRPSPGRLDSRFRAGLSGENWTVVAPPNLHPTASFLTLSPRRPGGEGRVRGADEAVCGAAHLTLPGAIAPGPLPLPPKGP
jgi:hypothetical protein